MSTTAIERRVFKASLRMAEGSSTRAVSGYAALYNSLSEDLGGFRELLQPGCFDTCLQDDVRCLFNHDPNMVLGRSTAGTLRYRSDDTGLYFECDLPDTQCARDLALSMERGDIDQCSFAFTVAAGGAMWEEQDKMLVRTVMKCSELFDVSPVTYPAYTDTSCQVRSMSEILSERTIQRPAAIDGGVSLDLLRRRLDLSLCID